MCLGILFLAAQLQKIKYPYPDRSSSMDFNDGPPAAPSETPEDPGEVVQPAFEPPEPPPAGPEKGIPENWLGHEYTHLAAGAWRFYRLAAQVRQTSIKEDNWVTRAGQPMPDAPGLEAFLREMDLLANPQAVPLEILAEQVGMFLIRGHSRRSCAVQVISETAQTEAGQPTGPPEIDVRDGRLLFKAWYRLGNHPEQLRLTLPPKGKLQVKWS
jgi:hypothetical protein